VKLIELLDSLEKFYGKPKVPKPKDPYEMVVYTNCGYPPSDAACTKGFAALKEEIGLDPDSVLRASDAKLTKIMRLGGIVPEVRAARLKEIAKMVNQDFGGDLRSVLKLPLAKAKKALKRFPTIGDPGAEKILLFTRTAPVPAVPSNCLHVPLRLGFGEEKKNYAASYRAAQDAIRADLPQEYDAIMRAYLVLKQHGETLCKRSRPRCQDCPVCADCRYFQSGQASGQATSN